MSSQTPFANSGKSMGAAHTEIAAHFAIPRVVQQPQRRGLRLRALGGAVVVPSLLVPLQVELHVPADAQVQEAVDALPPAVRERPRVEAVGAAQQEQV